MCTVLAPLHHIHVQTILYIYIYIYTSSAGHSTVKNCDLVNGIRIQKLLSKLKTNFEHDLGYDTDSEIRRWNISCYSPFKTWYTNLCRIILFVISSLFWRQTWIVINLDVVTKDSVHEQSYHSGLQTILYRSWAFFFSCTGTLYLISNCASYESLTNHWMRLWPKLFSKFKFLLEEL